MACYSKCFYDLSQFQYSELVWNPVNQIIKKRLHFLLPKWCNASLPGLSRREATESLKMEMRSLVEGVPTFWNASCRAWAMGASNTAEVEKDLRKVCRDGGEKEKPSDAAASSSSSFLSFFLCDMCVWMGIFSPQHFMNKRLKLKSQVITLTIKLLELWSDQCYWIGIHSNIWYFEWWFHTTPVLVPMVLQHA